MHHKETGWEKLNWIDMAQDRVRWRAIGNAAMNRRFPYNAGNLLIAEEAEISQETLWSTKLFNPYRTNVENRVSS